MRVCWEENIEWLQGKFLVGADPEAGNECALPGPRDLAYEFPRL